MLKELKLQLVSEAFDADDIGLYNPSMKLQRKPNIDPDVYPLDHVVRDDLDGYRVDIVVSFEKPIFGDTMDKLEEISRNGVVRL